MSSMSSHQMPIANVPRHIAIIMDGNNRWAKARGLPGPSGHKAGVEAIRAVLRACEKYGVEVLTLFAFSSENWRRPPREVSALMALFLSYLRREVKTLHESGVRVRVIGDRSRFVPRLRASIEQAENLTRSNTRTTLVIAADYGGQWDIAQAARRLALDVQAGKLDAAAITPQVFDEYTCLADLPKPDLCIRTGGEHRISNFLLWQAAYTELYFTDVFWPDFGAEQLADAILDYSQRMRRFGRTSEQVLEGKHA
jgi:undecaprenyl diphosphate synthase